MPTKIRNISVSIKAVVAELLATAMFVYIGTGMQYRRHVSILFLIFFLQSRARAIVRSENLRMSIQGYSYSRIFDRLR